MSDPSFIKFAFSLAESHLLRTLRIDDFTPAVVAAFSTYFGLKRDWPFAAADGIFGQVHAGDGLETPRRRFNYAELKLEKARVDGVLLCLGTAHESEAIIAGREVVTRSIDFIVEAVDG